MRTLPKALALPDGIVKQEVAEDGVAQQYSPPSSISISHKNQNVNKKDTADRINGLERPKPNEGYALTNDISDKSISQIFEKINTSDQSPLNKYKSPHTLKRAQTAHNVRGDLIY